MGLRNKTVALPAESGVISGAIGGSALHQSWGRCCERLRAELGEDIFNSWFGRLDLESVAGGQARLSVPTRFLKSWIDTHYLGHITSALAVEFGALARIGVVVRSSMRPEPQTACAAVCALPATARPPADPAGGQERGALASRRGTPLSPQPPSAAAALVGSPLDRRLTFATFQVGRSN